MQDSKRVADAESLAKTNDEKREKKPRPKEIENEEKLEEEEIGENETRKSGKSE